MQGTSLSFAQENQELQLSFQLTWEKQIVQIWSSYAQVVKWMLGS